MVENFVIKNASIALNSNAAIISRNHIEGGGLYITSSSRHLIENNTIQRGGISLIQCADSIILNNTISDNSQSYGIFSDRSAFNLIKMNNISNNEYGMMVGTSFNDIYLNTFMKNTNNVGFTGIMPRSLDIWHSSSPITYEYEGNTFENCLGNYWSDYTGTDSNNDGVGEQKYGTPGQESLDYHPLITPADAYKEDKTKKKNRGSGDGNDLLHLESSTAGTVGLYSDAITADASTVSILPLGDSITQADQDHASYRYWLWHTLQDNGYTNVDFCGTMDLSWSGTPNLYQDFDQDHEGHAGWRADHLINGRYDSNDRLATWLSGYTPDVVLLHIGTNDLNWEEIVFGISGEEVIANTIEDVEQIITILRSDNPDVTILVARIIPTTKSPHEEWNVNPLAVTYNSQIAGMADAMTTDRSPVIVVDHYSGFDLTADTYDFLHPDESGEKKMNTRWFGTLDQILDGSTTPPDEGITIDNTDAAHVSISGTWTPSTFAGINPPYGVNYLHDGNTGKGEKSVTFSPQIPEDGDYNVYIYYTQYSNRASNTPVDIVHAGQTDTVTVNQRVNGGQFYLLGTYTFYADSGGAIRIRNDATDGYVIADAVRIVYEGPPTSDPSSQPSDEGITIDNTDSAHVTMTGAWTTSSYTLVNPPYGANYLHDGNTGKGEKSVTFSPQIPEDGDYNVYIYYTQYSNRASNTPVDIVHAGQTDTLTVNQRINGGQFYLLGTYTFYADSGGAIRLRNDATDGYVIADAVRIVYEGPPTSDPPSQPSDEGITIDNTDSAHVAMTGAWTTSSYTLVNPPYGANYLHDGNTGKGEKSVTFSPQIPEDGDYNVYIYYTQYSNRASNTPVDIVHAGQTDTVTVNQRVNGGQFYLLGTYTFYADSGGAIRIRNDATDGYVIADAVRIVYEGPPTSDPPSQPSGEEIVIDNTDSAHVTMTGAWTTSSYTLVNPPYGANYLHDGNTGKGEKSVTFSPQIPEDGDYNVYIYYTQYSNRASNTPVDIVHAGQTDTVTVNQRVNGGQFYLLGTYTFYADSGGAIRIRNDATDGYVIADAV
ncbi:hypothetical protein CUJ86_10640, partial [Methanofollis fontis]